MRLLALLALVPALCLGAVSPSRPIAECAQHLPYGVPKSGVSDTTTICRPGYALQYDNKAKIPIWVAYSLNRATATGCAPRAKSFYQDPDIPSTARAGAKDFAKSSYQIGHLANSADMRWSTQASTDSNVFSNTAPQVGKLNIGAWKELEGRTRSWALDRDLKIYVGTIYRKRGASTIGANSVVVPAAFFKVLVDTQSREVVAFIYPNEASLDDPRTFQTSLAEVQRQAGITLPMPPGRIFRDTLWPVTASAASKKAVTCSTE